MLTTLPHLLGPAQLAEIDTLLRAAPFVDGKLSAGMAAERVKNNEELDARSELVEKLNKLVMGHLLRHPIYRLAALPRHVASPFYARYRAGMAYGEHIDDPVMGGNTPYRSDLSITVFLNPPQEYDGGELVIQTSFGEQSVKLPAGHAVLYPSSSRHRVSEVTRGERRVAVTWVQSLVRDPSRRQLLFELGKAREKMLRKQPDNKETTQVDYAYVNLVRMWAEV